MKNKKLYKFFLYKNVENYTINTKISNNKTIVYVHDFKNKCVIVHKSRNDFDDTKLCVKLFLANSHNDDRIESAQRIQKKCEKKYDEIITIGHSLGGNIAEYCAKKGKIITFNKFIGFDNLFKKIPKNQTDIYTKYDVSAAIISTQTGGKRILIHTNNTNIIENHSIDMLLHS